jgi:acyl-CoA reductase-like NAD-dependent aldehyde dehydrogenase
MTPVSAAKLSAQTGPIEIPMLIGGEWRNAAETYEVRDPYRNSVFELAPRPSLSDLDAALNAAAWSCSTTRRNAPL